MAKQKEPVSKEQAQEVAKMVGCSGVNKCDAVIDFGHWVGISEEGKPAVHYVIEAWNRRVT